MTIGRCLSAILISLSVSGGFVAPGQSVGALLTDAEKADIVGSLLQLEIVEQGSEYEKIRNLSSDNIGSVPATQIVAHGFRLLTAEQIERTRRDHIIEYVAIRGFYLRDGVVVEC